MNNATETQQLLVEILETLQLEQQALRVLDEPSISAAATKKLELDQRLRQLSPEDFSPNDEQTLREIQRKARDNTLLISHARACLQGVINLVLGQDSMPGATVRPTAAPPPIALNFRG